ncbi:MAG: Gfo/Idh/MocA family oxidoreductase [Planctomycetia bacterium]|jgi:predicted dehydrogenase
MSKFSRRRFLSDSAIAAAVLSAGPMMATRAFAKEKTAKKVSANDTLNLMVCGTNGRGKWHIKEFGKKPGCKIKYICDVDEAAGNKAIKMIEKKFGYKPKFVRDMRDVLDDSDLHIVSVATPNHWHALCAIWAMQAGKDVYLEKPVSHNVMEGQSLVATAKKYGRVCQTGTQCRSLKGSIDAIKYVQDGKLGEVKFARGLCYKPRRSIGPKGIYEPPKTVDYNLWVGPAQMQKVTRPRFHYDWHWQYHWGNGDMGNQGPHQMDLVRWGLDVDSLSENVISYGGRFGYVDAGDVANTQVAIHTIGDKTIVFEVRGLDTDPFMKSKIGAIFYGTDGIVVTTAYTKAYAMDNNGKIFRRFEGGGDHVQNFIDAVRAQDPKILNAEVREGHLSAALAHTGTISYRLGQKMPITEVKKEIEKFGGHDKNVETLDRTIAHLKKNKVDLSKTQMQLGPALKMDTKTETFTNNDEANTMLTRKYREGFVVPKPENV